MSSFLKRMLKEKGGGILFRFLHQGKCFVFYFCFSHKVIYLFQFFFGCTAWHVKVLVTQLCPTLCARMNYSPQASLSVGFSRQKFWSGLPFPSLWYLPDKGIEPGSPALVGRFFVIWDTGEAHNMASGILIPWPEMETAPPTAKSWRLKWTREVPGEMFNSNFF